MKTNNILIIVCGLSFSLLSCRDVKKEYYPNGQVKTDIEEYDDSCATKKGYYENGTLEFEGHYINRKENGIYKEYYTSGELQTLALFKDGKQHGVMIEYYENLKKKSVQSFKNGLSDGVFLFYYPSGQLKQYAHMEKGTTKFYHDYNEQGVLVKDYHYLEITPLQSDTIHEGDSYKAKIKLMGPLEYKHVYLNAFVRGYKLEDKYANVEIVKGAVEFEQNGLSVGKHTIQADAFCLNVDKDKFPKDKQPTLFSNARTIVVLPK